MYNLRYHVASLVAVFLFLAVGLLLGTIVAERGTLDEQRDTLISSLREQYEQLAADNDRLRDESADRGRFIDDVMPVLLSGQLEGRTVLLVTEIGRTDTLEAAREAVEKADATTAVMLVLVEDLGFDDPGLSQIATGYVDVAPTEDPEGYRTAVVRVIAEELTSAAFVRPLTAALVEAGVIELRGVEPGTAVDGLVLAGTGTYETGDPLLGLIRAAGALVPCAGVEAAGLPTGLAERAAEAGVSGVETLGTPESDFALAMVLAGRASGYFGDGPTAGARYPVVEPLER